LSRAEDIKPDGRSVNLFLGRSGGGKTAAACSYPRPMHVLDLDGRIRGGLTPWIDRKGIEYTYFPPKEKGALVFQKLNDFFDLLYTQQTMRRLELQTLVLDSITWASIDLVLDSMTMTHGTGTKGKQMGALQIPGMDDFKFRFNGINNIIAFLKTIAIPNIIVTAHVVNKWGKLRDKETGEVIDQYAENVIVGEQVNLVESLAETLPSSFDNIFYFRKDDTGKRFTFEAHGELARTAYHGIPYGKLDVTGKSFYDTLQKDYVSKMQQTQV